MCFFIVNMNGYFEIVCFVLNDCWINVLKWFKIVVDLVEEVFYNYCVFVFGEFLL